MGFILAKNSIFTILESQTLEMLNFIQYPQYIPLIIILIIIAFSFIWIIASNESIIYQ